MTRATRYDTPKPPATDPAAPGAWRLAGLPWGDLSVDQPDGFGTVSEPELPSPDVNDDRGYGFGV
jgi:hypothetical protein